MVPSRLTSPLFPLAWSLAVNGLLHRLPGLGITPVCYAVANNDIILVVRGRFEHALCDNCDLIQRALVVVADWRRIVFNKKLTSLLLPVAPSA